MAAYRLRIYNLIAQKFTPQTFKWLHICLISMIAQKFWWHNTFQANCSQQAMTMDELRDATSLRQSTNYEKSELQQQAWWDQQ